MKSTRMRMFAEDCLLLECAPWTQVENGKPLTKSEVKGFAKRNGFVIVKKAELVTIRGKVFTKAEDMAVCLGHSK